MIAVVGKKWGSEHWVTNEAEYCGKFLEIYPGFQCSLHYHPIKKETFHVTRGFVTLEQRDVRGVPFSEVLGPGDTRTIMPKTPHRFRSVEGATILEISTHHEDSDVVRITESGPIDATDTQGHSKSSGLTEKQ